MKKFLFLFLFIASIYAEVTVVSIFPTKNKTYYMLSDGTFWTVTSFIKRWRTVGEWIRGDELYVPDHFVSSPGDWAAGQTIEIYSKYDHLRIDESFAENVEALKQCTHLFVNTRTEKILFALPLDLHPADFMALLYNDGRNDGYDKGYEEGYSIGHSYGYSAGYSIGYSSGQAANSQ